MVEGRDVSFPVADPVLEETRISALAMEEARDANKRVVRNLLLVLRTSVFGTVE